MAIVRLPPPIQMPRASLKRAAPVAAKRGPWSSDEDALLSATVAVHGVGKWVSIARIMGTERLAKQCRGRWVKHLDPTRSKPPPRVRDDDIELVCDEAVAHLIEANPAQVLRDPDLLPQRATTSVMQRVVIVSSPTGCRGLGMGTFSPFKDINAMVRGHRDARADAWDGLPRHFAPLL